MIVPALLKFSRKWTPVVSLTRAQTTLSIHLVYQGKRLAYADDELNCF